MIANKQGQSLTSHLAGVALLAKYLCLNMDLQESVGLTFPSPEIRSEWDLSKISEECFWAGIYHDLGKIDPFFQEYLQSKLLEESTDGVHISSDFRSGKKDNKLKKDENFNLLHPYHHEISWALMRNLQTGVNSRVEHAVFYHHGKRVNDEFKTSEKILEVFDGVADLYDLSIKTITEAANKAGIKTVVFKKEESDNSQIPDYKKFKLKNQEREYQWAFNTLSNLVRIVLVNADQIVSSLTSDELENFLASKDYSIFGLNFKETDFLNFDTVIEKFGGNENPRLQEQNTVVDSLKEKHISICGAPAGSGKTLMSLLYSHNTAKKIIYIAPRVTICQELYKSLTSDEYPHSYSVEILTGDHKEKKKDNIIVEDYELMSSDIIITTIDSIIRLFSSHRRANMFLETFTGTIVFDEFHEVRNLPSMFYTFGEILYTFLLKKSNNVLLMSATPDPVFLEQFGISKQNILKMDSFNKQKYQVSLVDVPNYYNDKGEDLYNLYLDNLNLPEGGAIILDSVDKVQELFCKNQTSKTHIAHSRMTYEDRQKMMDRLYTNFGKSSLDKSHRLYSGPIVKASLNISFKELFLTICSPNDMLQSLGRLNRFGEGFVGKLTVLVPRSKKDNSISLSGFSLLKEIDYSENSAKQFILFLSKRLSEKAELSLSDIYNLYYEFFNEVKGLEVDFKKIKEAAYQFIAVQDGLVDKKLLEVSIEKKKQLVNSLRGESVFVNAVVIEDGKDIGHVYDHNSPKKELFLTVSPEQGLENSIKRFGSGLFSKTNRKKILEFMGLPKHLALRPEWIEFYFKNSATPCYLSFSNLSESSKEIKELDSNQELNYYYYKSSGVAIGLVSNKVLKKISGIS